MSQTNREMILSSAQNGTDDMALKIFSGMVLEAFQNATHFYNRSNQFISVKQIEGANSAQWPILGDDPAPAYHVPGTVLNLQLTQGTNVTRTKTAEAVVTVDEILVNALDVPFRDLEISHFDVLGPYATKLGRGIAKVLDQKIAILATKAARTAASSGIHGGGYVVYRDDGSATTSGSADIALAYPLNPTGAYNFRQDLAALAQAMDEKSVPEGSRYLFINPHIKSVLRFEAAWNPTGSTYVPGVVPSSYSSEFNTNPNDVNKRVIGMLEGFNIIVSNYLPTKNLNSSSLSGEDAAIGYAASTGAASGGKYQGRFDGAYNATLATARGQARPVAIAMCSADTGSPAIGMVQASGLRTYVEADERRNTQFMKAQMMAGLGIICPWSAGSIEIFRDG